MFNFAGRRNLFYILSGVIILAGILSLSIAGLKPGIDFISGSTMTIRFVDPVEQSALRDILIELGHSEAVIQKTGDGDFLIRTKELRPAEGTGPSEQAEIEEALRFEFGDLEVKDSFSVSRVIAGRTVRNAGYAVLAAVIAILLYITWAFRKLPKPFRYGVCAIIALFHDVMVIVGIFSILGWLANIEVNSMFIIAVLTIIGYSVNDTIVVFDRIRENLSKAVHPDFKTIVNISLSETLGRSLATSMTTLIVLLALFLFGGTTITNFVLVLIIGVISGTYSSIFVASPLLVSWENGDFGRIWKRIKSLWSRNELAENLPSKS